MGINQDIETKNFTEEVSEFTSFKAQQLQVIVPDKKVSYKTQILKFKKQLLKNNLSEKFESVAQSAKDSDAQDAPEENSEESKDGAKELTAEEKKKADEKKEEADFAKKEKEANEKKRLAEDNAELPTNPDAFKERKSLASDSIEFETNFSQVTLSSLEPKAVEDEEDTNNLSPENDDNNSNTAGISTTPKTVENFGVFTPSYFKSLLVNNKLVEFEQALQEELTLEQKQGAYTEALNFLFSKENEEFSLYENFIRSQFLKHKFAISIAKTFSEESFSEEQVEYSADLLTKLVATWSSEDGDSSKFNDIYSVAVLGAIPLNIADNEILLSLQNSIERTSFNISDSSVEISSN